MHKKHTYGKASKPRISKMHNVQETQKTEIKKLNLTTKYLTLF